MSVDIKPTSDIYLDVPDTALRGTGRYFIKIIAQFQILTQCLNISITKSLDLPLLKCYVICRDELW